MESRRVESMYPEEQDGFCCFAADHFADNTEPDEDARTTWESMTDAQREPYHWRAHYVRMMKEHFDQADQSPPANTHHNHTACSTERTYTSPPVHTAPTGYVDLTSTTCALPFVHQPVDLESVPPTQTRIPQPGPSVSTDFTSSTTIPSISSIPQPGPSVSTDFTLSTTIPSISLKAYFLRKTRQQRKLYAKMDELREQNKKLEEKVNALMDLVARS